MKIKVIYKKLVPLFVRHKFSSTFYKLHLLLSPVRNRYLLKKVSKKSTVNVLLFMYNVDAWKLHSVYQEFEQSERFKPIVIVCPIITKGKAFLLDKISASISYCKQNDYNYFVAYDFNSDEVLDVKHEFSCDIVFFTNPNQLSGEKLYIDNFDDCLTCYVPYSFRIDRLYQYEYNNRTVNKVWKCFYETEIHKQLAEEYADNKGRNVVVSGFPYFDMFKTIEVTREGCRKLIVWAPHWTIKGAQTTGLDWACFLDYYDLVLELADRYKEKLCFVMKPHPFLFETLKQESVWGVAKVDSYIAQWEERENCRIETGDYMSLFMESDALIHDGGSFMTEYLLQNKPMAYMLNTEFFNDRFNEWGDIVMECHRQIYTKEDLVIFVKDVLCDTDLEKNLRCRVNSKFIDPVGLIGKRMLNEILINNDEKR